MVEAPGDGRIAVRRQRLAVGVPNRAVRQGSRGDDGRECRRRIPRANADQYGKPSVDGVVLAPI
jgi:hypothetical protein